MGKYIMYGLLIFNSTLLTEDLNEKFAIGMISAILNLFVLCDD